MSTEAGTDRPGVERIARVLPAETDIRHKHRVDHVPGMSGPLSWCPSDQRVQPCDTQVLIGIIDALRAATPAPPEPDDRYPGLLKIDGGIGNALIVGTDYRVAEIVTHIEPSGVQGVLGHETTVVRFDPVPAPSGPALDVERLARAMFEAERPGDWPTWTDYTGAFGSPGIAPWRRKADRIAAEYERLREGSAET